MYFTWFPIVVFHGIGIVWIIIQKFTVFKDLAICLLNAIIIQFSYMNQIDNLVKISTFCSGFNHRKSKYIADVSHEIHFDAIRT